MDVWRDEYDDQHNDQQTSYDLIEHVCVRAR